MMTASPIPHQLHGCRFIKVKARDKVAIEPDWHKSRNYAYDDPHLLKHIAGGGNYGVMVRGGICCLDADAHEQVRRTGLLKPLSGTFQVRRGDRAHYYFRCDELPAEKFILTLNGEQIGDVRGSGGSFYLVGPGCTHPSGDSYDPVDPDAPIKRIPLQAIKPILDILCKPKRHQTSDTGARQAPGSPAQPHGKFLEGEIIEGLRNDTLAKVAGYYWSRGRTHQQVLSLLRDANIERCNPPLADDEVQQIAGSICCNYPRGPARKAIEAHTEAEADGIADRYPGAEILAESKSGRIAVLHGALAERLHADIQPISFNGKLFVYDEGVFIPDDGRISQRIREVLEFFDIRTGLINTINEVKTHLHAMHAHGSSPFDRQKYMIPVQNGVIRFLPENNFRVELLPHSPDYRFSHRLPVRFNPDADSTTISEVLSQWLPDGDQVYLRQMAALPFYQRWRAVAKVAFIIEGAKDSGKTTWLNFLAALFGEGVCGVSLDRICSDRYAVAQMEGRLLNIYDELPTVKLRNYDSFKKLSGGEAATIERKHQNAYDGTITCLHVFSCNKPPAGEGLDDAFFSRWNYLLFTNCFERDETFMEKLLTEENLSAFLNIISQELQGLLSGAVKIKRMDAEEVADVWQLNSDEIRQFVHDCCDLVADDKAPPGAMVQKDDLYAVYQAWCKDNRVTVLDKTVFSKRLSRQGISSRRSLVRGRQVQHYAGLKFKSNIAPKREVGQVNVSE